ncbi:hypothetical protein [Hymenobacter sp. BT190]|uniref:hypothetical protein n=1 Tax=Hymenobacter sp. BT190 TaxID=2763505 RepID=UPI0016518FFC|nr:hypothetical protein [Hymenobacter sp. BT190]MBC6697343.1 hypothetical protein [Hymenobacter sp. BT190]
MFSSTKAGHLAHILTTALVGQVASHELTPPDPDTIEQYGHLIIQALVAIVTIWATVRKALQKPENVVKAPVVGVVASPAAGAPEAAVTPGTDGKE